jgi:multisubunit Na+/H+ antiporter MnhB subunit
VSEQLKTARNVGIVLVIAAAVYFIPGGGRAAGTFEATLWVAFALGLGYLGLRQYREHRIAIHGLGDRHRALLYGAIALAFFDYASYHRMWETSFGTLVWFVLVGCVIYAAMEVFRHSRTY